MTSQVFDSPLLVIAGFPRTGTTSIYYNLDKHPAFRTARRKELNFFCGGQELRLADFERLFGDTSGGIAVDASPFYSLAPESAGRIKSFAPQALVVLMLRDPTTWIVSVYRQLLKHAPRGTVSFEGFLAAPHLAGNGAKVNFNLSDGVYRPGVERFAKLFGADLLVLDFRMFASDPLAVLNRIEDFCGVSRFFTPATVDAEPNNTSESLGPVGRLVSSVSSHSWATRVIDALPRGIIRFAQKLLYGKGKRMRTYSRVVGLGPAASCSAMSCKAFRYRQTASPKPVLP
jgi:hypothetical protein